MSNDTAAQPVYFIAHITVNDVEGYRNYEKGFFPVLKPSGARFVTYDDNVTVLEGERESGRTIMIEFPSEEALMIWWDSPEYRELAKVRQAAVTTHSVSVIHSLPPR
ncbi:MAG: hypothetical protein ACI9N0_000545 [Ilumatobacter sp.]|jgi:uncharacterized protein (DUF1330 family)